MTDEEKKLMDQYEITCETKTIFHYRGHRYDRLDDALNYAKKEMVATTNLQVNASKN